MLIDADKLFDRLMEELKKDEPLKVEDPIRADAYRIGRKAAFEKVFEILEEMRKEALEKKLDEMFPR